MEQPDLEVNPASEKSAESYTPTPVVRDEHSEDTLTRLLEHQTAKLPSDLFLFSALAAMGASFALELYGNSRLARFVGMWPPALLMMGIYNKLVKMMGPR
jgi:hypothetical protein